MPNYKSKFNENWMKQFPWVRAVDDDIYKAQCKWCECEFKVDVRGIGAVKQHRDTAKHKAKESESNHGSADDPPGDDDVLNEDATTDQQDDKGFETHWFDSEAATESDNSASNDSSLHSDQEQKHIPHLSQSVSATPKKSNSHPKTNDRNSRTLSVQRMKMFEAELRVWQRKGEAIVKLMETVGHDKEMWEIINKQSRQHDKERDRIREEYDIL